MSGRRRTLVPACSHDLYWYVDWIARLACRVRGHDWHVCERHALRWCDRCREGL